MPLTTIGTDSIDALAITTAKLAADSVTAPKIAADAVGTSEIAANAVDSSEIAANAVTTTEIVDNAVTGAKIALTSDVAGDVMYYNGTDYVRLAIGTAAQALKVNGGATAPEWGTDSTTTINTNADNRLISGSDTANTLNGEANLTYDGTTVGIKNAGTASDIKLYCESSNAHYVSIKSPAHADFAGGNWTLTLPGIDGVANEFLQTNGSGVTSWADPLPIQTSNAGKLLLTDGTDASWVSRPNRNVVINGDHRISQRGTTFTPSTASGSSLMYTLDRYYAYRSAGTNDGICDRVIGEAPQGFNYHMRMGRADNSSETGGYMRIGQQIETLNCFGLAGQTCCFSFYMKKHANFACNNFGIVIATGTGTDQPAWDTIGGGWTDGANTYNNTSVLNDITTSWVRRFVTVDIPAGTKEIAVSFSFNAWTGTNITSDYVDVAGIQFEIGSAPSAFDHKPIQRELMDCGRYYQRIPGPFLVPTASTTAIAGGGARSTTSGHATLIYWATMRTNPSFTGAGTMYMHDLVDGNNITITSFGTVNTIGLSRCWLNCGSSGTMAPGDSIIFYGSGGTGDYFALDAEL